MKNSVFKKGLNKKVICTLIVICFLTISMNQCMASYQILEEQDSLCYGFIVSPVKDRNMNIIDQINCKIRHMINDLLREQIPVFWTAENVNVDVKGMNSSDVNQNRLFERGSFIIPFTGNLADDKKIIAIMYDYNQSSEIETNNEISIPIYIILDQISTNVFPLNDVKVAQFYSRVTCGGFIFLELLSKCGFLNVEIVKNKDINAELNLDDFNVLFHPGGGSDLVHFISHRIYEDIVYKESDGVRAFIKNGGGYIGVCGGLTKASAGHSIGKLPIQIYFKRRVYNPNLRSIGVYAIADILYYAFTTSYGMGDVQVKIISGSSPITYGLDEIVWDAHYGAPEVYYTGENVEVIANFHNTGTRFDGTPSWITTTFGTGKVAIFVNHPEIAGMKKHPVYVSQLNTGKTVISNSLFHTTAEDKIEYQTDYTQNLTFLEEIWETTADLTSSISEIEGIFNPIRDRINETNDFIACLTDNLSEVVSIIEDIATENKIKKSTTEYKYYLGLDYAKDVKIYYYDLFTRFLNDTLIVFDKIELIHNLLKNDANFKQRLKTLINEISDRLDKTQQILQDSQNMIESYEQNILEYKKRILRSRIKENQLKKEGNNFYLHSFSGFSQVPQTYFNSLKFLRSEWYDYEASIAL